MLLLFVVFVVCGVIFCFVYIVSKVAHCVGDPALGKKASYDSRFFNDFSGEPVSKKFKPNVKFSIGGDTNNCGGFEGDAANFNGFKYNADQWAKNYGAERTIPRNTCFDSSFGGGK